MTLYFTPMIDRGAERDLALLSHDRPSRLRTKFGAGQLGVTRLTALQVTHMNDALLSQIDMQPLESFTFKGANDEEVQGFMVKPPGFDPNKKYPLKFLIHGGPQGAWGN